MALSTKQFQTIALVVFGAIFVFAVLVFSQIIPIGKSNQQGAVAGEVVIWGTQYPSYYDNAIDELEEENDTLTITYVQKNEATFNQDLIEALAIGEGPDVFVLPHTNIVKYQDKVYPISYERIPKQYFQNQFVDQADLLLSPDGTLGLPFLLDPLVMYYNKNLLASKFITQPPEYWDEFYAFSEQITEAASISVDLSAVALGGYDNIDHAKDILSAMFMQTRNPVVIGRRDGFLGTLVQDYANQRNFTAQTLDFYTSFTDPTKSHYSWNEGMKSSREAFLAEELAVYFGYASEARDLFRLNPNINMGVALFPQMRNMPKRTYARMDVMMLSRQSENPLSAVQVMQQLTGQRYGVSLAYGLQQPPVYTSLLTARPSEADYIQTFYNSAIISDAWLDPDPVESEAAFRRMVRDVNAGVLGAESAVVRANQAITEAFPKDNDLQLGGETALD